MKKLIILSLSALFFACNTSDGKKNEVQKEEIKEKKVTENLPKIAFLGSFHFGNTSDYSSIKMDDLHTEKRQKEVAEIVKKLVAFKPTKILVEREPSYNDTLNRKYASYLNGEYKLPTNELYQIGFRLAKELNHEQLFGIDYEMGLGDEELVNYLEKHNLMEKFSSLLANTNDFAADFTSYLKTHTLNETLIKLNQAESDNFNKNIYLESVLNFVEKGNSPASDFVSNWWKRNIFIKKNIDDVITENDRILVLIGSGHSAVIKDFYKGSSNVELIEINPILEK
ncbi:DUF5694 domain-containing protein [Aureivirga marina]|uniref:DUF5694 domain-containing protein n=1 Tax=Aureivirga marina TaxID=1182451 RepID=UPI0018C97AFB|nr:DUF5694 domain-containing protein [Aureivirga marina]